MLGIGSGCGISCRLGRSPGAVEQLSPQSSRAGELEKATCSFSAGSQWTGKPRKPQRPKPNKEQLYVL
ncbi:hypothetical protein VZT92_013344 [Zoarces viviparus]